MDIMPSGEDLDIVYVIFTDFQRDGCPYRVFHLRESAVDFIQGQEDSDMAIQAFDTFTGLPIGERFWE